MSDWEDEAFDGAYFDDPDSCECLSAFNRDECDSCGHDLACIEVECDDEDHRDRLAKSCECQTGNEVENCDDCFHNLECALADCENEIHLRVITYGNPNFCSCRESQESTECSTCGHSIACLEGEVSECFEPDHEERFVYFNYPGDCECSNFEEPLNCDSCKHDLNCPVNDNFCWNHQKAEQISPKISQGSVGNRGIETSEHSTIKLESTGNKKAGKYWTREDDEILAAHYLGGSSDAEISRLLGRSVRAIQSRQLKICFEAQGLTIGQTLTYPSEARAHWAETDDHLLEGLASSKVEISQIAKLLQRSELAVAFRLVARRLIKPGNLDLISYHEPKVPDVAQDDFNWTVNQYLLLKEQFKAGGTISDLALKSGRSAISCLHVLFQMGDIRISDLNLALNSALQGLDSQDSSQKNSPYNLGSH